MVFNSLIVIRVAHKSAEVWQQLIHIPEEQISSQQLLDLVCCFPLQQFGRFALCLWSFFCFPPPDSYLTYSYYDDSDSSSSFDFDYDYDDDDDDDDIDIDIDDDDDHHQHHHDYHYASHSD